MIGIYLIIAIILSIWLFFNRSTLVNNLLLIAFVILQIVFTVYECYHINETELQYFRPDALGILLLVTLCIISVPAILHSYIYLENHKETTSRMRAIFFAALVMLISAIGVAYLSNHIAVTWIFVEITTLSASALIYHHRNERSLARGDLEICFYLRHQCNIHFYRHTFFKHGHEPGRINRPLL